MCLEFRVETARYGTTSRIFTSSLADLPILLYLLSQLANFTFLLCTLKREIVANMSASA